MGVTVELTQTGASTMEAAIRDHKVKVDRPAAKNGTDEGPMGGELLLAALGGCFASNLLAAIRAREAAIADVHITVDGVLSDAPSRFSSIEMVVTAEHDDRALLEKLVLISERSCIVANTLKGGVELLVRVAE